MLRNYLRSLLRNKKLTGAMIITHLKNYPLDQSK